ncbi:MAG: alpha/beta hydrolase [Flammeovirgaceae bacterium]
MPSFQFDWQTIDNLKLVGECWLPESNNLKAICCLIHGFGEHIGRYEHVATFLNLKNIGLIGFDLRGHGKSEGRRGIIPNYEALMQNIGEFLALTQHKFPDVPLILYGHSMGGNLALSYVLRYKPTIKAAIITSPWIRLTHEAPFWKVFLGKMIAQVYSTYTDVASLNPDHLSRDLSVGKAYVADKLVHNRMGVTLFLAVEDAGEQILQNAKELQIPVLLMHGSDDQITSPNASQLFKEYAGSLVEFVLWKDARHELQNEINKEEVIGKMIEWIDKVLA